MGFPFKCFLVAYKGYHQIQMSKEDKEKTSFYTDQGTYCYTKMLFRLKNAGAIYKRAGDDNGHKINLHQPSKGQHEVKIKEVFIRCKGGKVPRSVERALPFFETLKNITNENKDDYRWAEDAKRAFQEMKTLIIKLPKMTTPLPKEALFVYLAASKYMNAIKGQHGRMDLVYKWSIKMEGSGC
ncbi:hypothetical protein Tco_1487246, partial [Tanacetum coccineum]